MQTKEIGMRTVDKTKKSNIKCEHCKYWTKEGLSNYHCVNKESQYYKEFRWYYNRCKAFEWKEKYNEDCN